MGFDIREVRPEEYEEAGRITADAYREYVPPGDRDWQAYLEDIADVVDRAKRTTVLVAVEDGEILGTATLELEGRTEKGRERDPLAPGEAHVRMVGVRPGARRRGIARALMDECVRRARETGKTLLTLNTGESMKAAHAMYESMGFRRNPDQVFDDDFVLRSYELPLG
jgi:ribosomal protein S18 acetylase RimI-like enzyme